MFFNIFCYFFDLSNNKMSQGIFYAILAVKNHFGKVFVFLLTSLRFFKSFQSKEPLELLKLLKLF